MKRLICFLPLVIFIAYSGNLTAQSQNGWFQIQTGMNANLSGIEFVNALTGFACSESGKIFKTTDGGFSWQLKFDDANTPLRSLFFINSTTGWAGGGKTSFGGPFNSSLVILKTTNNGESWFIQLNTSDFYTTVSSLKFLNSDTGFASGMQAVTDLSSFGSFLKTTNGGTNWILISPHQYSYNDVFFINSSTGFIAGHQWSDVGNDSGIVRKTTDGGLNWNTIFSYNKSWFFTIESNTDEIYFGGRLGFPPTNSILFKSDLDGNILSIDTTSIPTAISNINFLSNNVGYILAGSNPYKTINKGGNWNQQSLNSSSSLNTIFFSNENTGWIAGNNGAVYKTYTGGEVLPPDTVSPKYFPLKVGNKWVYNASDFYTPNYGKVVIKVVGEEIHNGKRYFVLNSSPPYYWAIDKIRIDSLNGNLYAYDPNYNTCGSMFERVIDSLKSDSGNAIQYCEPYFGFSTCTNFDTITVLGVQTERKDFQQSSIISFYRYYAKNIGPFYGFTGHYWWDWNSYVLKGCEIDGVVYGDTSTILTYTISGTVRNYFNFQFINNGSVKAVRYDPISDSVITIATTNINSNGTYTLSGIPKDSVDIMAYQDDQVDFVPTYYPATIYWEQSTTLYPTSNLNNVNVWVYPLTNSSGNIYNISGHVYKNSETNPLNNVFVYAKNGNNFFNADISGSNGSFMMENTQGGSYSIIVNRFGYNTITRNVLVNFNIDTLKFYMDRISSLKNVSQTIPPDFKLNQNYPNPFNPTTKISFDIPERINVILVVFDIAGKEMKQLINENLNAGSYEVSFDARELSSGVYFYRLEAGKFTETKRMVMVK